MHISLLELPSQKPSLCHFFFKLVGPFYKVVPSLKFQHLLFHQCFRTTTAYISYLCNQQTKLLALSIILPVDSTYPLLSFLTVHTFPYLFHEDFQHSNFQILPQIFVTRKFFAPPAHLRAARDWGPRKEEDYWSFVMKKSCAWQTLGFIKQAHRENHLYCRRM